MPTSNKKKFTAVLEKPDDGMDTAFISIPFDVEKVYGSKAHIKVKATFDGHPYRGILANMGTGCHVIIVRKDIRQAINKGVGDKIQVEIEPDMEERIVNLPDDLKGALARSAKAEKFFQSLSYTNRKEYAVWITSAKKEETREKRLTETIKKLLAGKKNPSEK
ncbi:MAG: YdeI/OmpD-associated family protein [Flammeovirgaceae bacterium]|nr:YdeI/OmpD-associated family protein [Flammeovirgaceae bacterium]